ncbi:hypothetical protein NXW15_00595 [Bacteroides thetaiotaomicron]|uniref:hypothetical protein n=1 Tax=Bacteroides thetaiotaomicron TaxID=818 RepID=UPI002164FF1E|nr:hypothetical protein [Bacteroides thetaiotaomicron]MCS3305988.1 hypothetical protein [Bacteroides thetaiotaomicron]
MKRKLMLLLACLFVGISLVTAQTQKVTGVVISEEDWATSCLGASVLVKGTTQGTITDIDGNFILGERTKFCKDFADFVYWYANTRSGNQANGESYTEIRCTKS